MEENKVGKKEELGLWGGSEETNQDNAVCKTEGWGKREREMRGSGEMPNVSSLTLGF